MKLKILLLAAFTLTLVSACAPATVPVATEDVNAIRTSAAYTVVAEFTLTAAAVTETPVPPTETATRASSATTGTATTGTVVVTNPTLIALGTPGALCDSMSFDPATVDVTIPDGSSLTAGQEFVKTWKIKNDGACTWGEGYALIYSYGERMNGQPVPLSGVVAVGQEAEVSVNLKAPDKAGEYLSAWQMVNDKGVPFGKALFLKIIVQ